MLGGEPASREPQSALHEVAVALGSCAFCYHAVRPLLALRVLCGCMLLRHREVCLVMGVLWGSVGVCVRADQPVILHRHFRVAHGAARADLGGKRGCEVGTQAVVDMQRQQGCNAFNIQTRYVNVDIVLPIYRL